MDTRTHLQVTASNTSMEASLSQKREALVMLVHSCDLFDKSVLAAFDQSRQPNGRYEIHAGDPSIINNAKALINLLYTLERLIPRLFVPIRDIAETEGWDLVKTAQAAFQIGGDIIGGITGVGEGNIKQVFSDIGSLKYYIGELKASVSMMPSLSESFSPLLDDLQKQINDNLDPIIVKAKHLQIDSLKNAKQEEVNFAKMIKKSLSVKSISSMYQPIVEMKAKVDEQISELYDININPTTGLYDESLMVGDNASNLMHISNLLFRTKSTLERLDRLVNQHEVNPLLIQEIIVELSKAVKELHGVDLSSVEKIGAEQLLEAMKMLTKSVEPIIIQSVCYADITESRLGLRDRGIEGILASRCSEYQHLAKELGVTLRQRYPYWEERLLIRQQELAIKQSQYVALTENKIKIVESPIGPDSSLRELLRISRIADDIPARKTKAYAKKIKKMISKKTGMYDLDKHITECEKFIIALESQLKTVTDTDKKQQLLDNKEEAITKLQALYDLKHELTQRIDSLDKNQNASDQFSYQSGEINVGSIEDRSIILSKKQCIAEATRLKTLSAIDSAMVNMKNDIDRLTRRIDSAEYEIRVERNLASGTTQLQISIEAILPESLYIMSLNELRRIHDQVYRMNNPATSGFTKTLQTVLEERSGMTELNETSDALKKSLEAAKAKKTILENRLGEYERAQKRPAILHEVEDEIIKLRFYKNQVYSKLVSEKYNIDSQTIINNISKRLGFKSDGTQVATPDQVKEELKYSNTWAGWIKSKALGATPPLIEKMDAKITELEAMQATLQEFEGIKKQIDETSRSMTDLDQKKSTLQMAIDNRDANLDDAHTVSHNNYRGTNLSTFQADRSAVLEVLREQRTAQLIEKLGLTEKQAAMSEHGLVEEPEIKEETSLVETSDQLVERLLAEDKGALVSTSIASRSALIASCKPYLEESQIKALENANPNTGLYDITISDALLVRNVKSLNNTMIRFEQLIMSIQSHVRSFRAQKNMSTYLAIAKDLPTILIQAKALAAEIRGLQYNLDQLRATLPNLPDTSQLTAVVQFNQLVNPMLASYQSMLEAPIVSQFMRDVLHADFTAQISQTVDSLRTIAEQKPSVSSDKPLEFQSLQKAIIKLQQVIKNNYGIENNDNKLYNTNSINDANQKNLLLLTNTLINLQRTLSGMLVVADDKTMKGDWTIIANLIGMAAQLRNLDLSGIEEAKEAIKLLLEESHPLLTQFIARAEIAEAQLGLKHGVFSERVESLCKQFENMADQFDATLKSRYPYYEETLGAFAKEKDKLENQLELLTALQAKLNQFSISTATLYELVATRKTLRDLGLPMLRYPTFMEDLDKAIREKTGLDKLEETISQDRNQLRQSEIKLANTQSNQVTITVNIVKKTDYLATLSRIKVMLDQKELLPYADLEVLYTLFKHYEKASFDDFCTMLVSERRIITGDVHAQTKMSIHRLLELKIDSVKEQLDTEEQRLQQCKSDIVHQRASCDKARKRMIADERMVTDLNNRIDNIITTDVSSNGFKYDPDDNNIVEGGTYPVTTVTTVRPDLSDMQEQLNINISSLDDKMAKLELDKANYLNNIVTSPLAYFKELEKKMGIKPGTFETQLKIPKNQEKIKTLAGLFEIFIQSNSTAMTRYAPVLQQANTGSDTEFAKLIREAAAKRSTLLLRILRKLRGKPSFNDQLYNLAVYFMKEENQSRYRQLTGSTSTSATNLGDATTTSGLTRVLSSQQAVPTPAIAATRPNAPATTPEDEPDIGLPPVRIGPGMLFDHKRSATEKRAKHVSDGKGNAPEKKH